MAGLKPSFHQRQYIRHPSRMPIRFDLHGGAGHGDELLRNVSEGGLCFSSQVALEPGLTIHVVIPVLGQEFAADGVVAWCQRTNGAFEVGVKFGSTQERFSVRMVEQLCYIEDYRQQVARNEGRDLSSEQAASEWIERFAEKFPGLH